MMFVKDLTLYLFSRMRHLRMRLRASMAMPELILYVAGIAVLILIKKMHSVD